MANPSGSNQTLVKIYNAIFNAIRVMVVNAILPDGPANASPPDSIALDTNSQTALALNDDRQGAVLVNDNSSGRIVYIAFAASASPTAWTYKLNAGQTLELKPGCYTGVVSFVATAGLGGNLMVTEIYR